MWSKSPQIENPQILPTTLTLDLACETEYNRCLPLSRTPPGHSRWSHPRLSRKALQPGGESERRLRRRGGEKRGAREESGGVSKPQERFPFTERFDHTGRTGINGCNTRVTSPLVTQTVSHVKMQHFVNWWFFANDDTIVVVLCILLPHPNYTHRMPLMIHSY